MVNLYKDGFISADEFKRETTRIANRLLTMAPAEVTEVELALSDFERFRENWALATPEERHDIIQSMIKKVDADMKTGQMEIVPKPGFRAVFEAPE